jgi:hypothetical protein
MNEGSLGKPVDDVRGVLQNLRHGQIQLVEQMKHLTVTLETLLEGVKGLSAQATISMGRCLEQRVAQS